MSISHPLVKVQSITIRVPPHSGSESSRTVKSSPIVASTKCRVNQNPWIIDGDSGDWTCPICGGSYKYFTIGNSKVKVDNKLACQSDVQFKIEHNGTLVSQDVEYDNRVNIL